MYPFRKGSLAVRNGWYVAAFTHEIARTLLPRTILNEPVVLYRKEDGTAVAVAGRCPHRHYPLGKSCLNGDAIVCGYHGIAFDADGQCIDIPSQDFVPRTYRIRSYPLVEHGLWAFIWMGDASMADPALLPDLDELGFNTEGLEIRPFCVEHVNGRSQLLNDNLLDLSHLAYLHSNSLGTPDVAKTAEVVTKRPGFLSSRRTMQDAAAPQLLSALGEDVDKVHRTTGMDFYLPGFHAGIDEFRYPEGHERAGEMVAFSRIFHAVTPATWTSCHYFFAAATDNAAALDMMADYIKPIIAEDKFATEEIEKMLALIGDEPDELLIKSDRNAVEGRRMLQAMMDSENVI